MKRIRVLIVDDSTLVRGHLRDILEADEGMEVVGEARNGREAVEMTRKLQPGVVTMDLEMPVMGGLEAIEEIMHSKAVPILVVSASVSNAQCALQAIGCGAIEVMVKPRLGSPEVADFVAKVRLLAGVSVVTRLRPRKTTVEACATAALSIGMTALTQSTTGPDTYPKVFAIACSTGGPQALAQILSALPSGFSCPVLVAQHIADGFASGMVDWLRGICRLPVRLAQQGEPLQAGVIHFSPSEKHLSVTPTRHMALLARSPRDVFHPSCDVLLSSVAEVFGPQAVGMILTGMSHDGAKGMANIREKGGMTLAQDEATSVVFGMNRVAIESGCVRQVLPLKELAPAMVQLASRINR
ncbi:MAG: two-component system chemotaxis family response regulator CheB [Comamonadaceae bacterium]|nr:MAG: two-component system chemotaxis family response regulator CheB [Comamonadaceae bacterium]